ncbi:uncharacterized protein LOC112685168 [Sipha flava]|nr:uncharacterized protein LOC112685168 [Sipha flava]
MKSYYKCSRLIVLANTVFCSSIIITMTFTFIVTFSSSELSSVFYLVKIASTDLYVCFQIYLYCKLFENLNNKKDSVNFSIYSSDWTNMNLKSKKLLLLAMNMNNVNWLQMKASPRRHVDLQQFLNVLTTCYNIISVMVNTLKK